MCHSVDLAKNALAGFALLSHLDLQYPLQLVTDASCPALEGVVQQIVDGHPSPLAFFSCSAQIQPIWS